MKKNCTSRYAAVSVLSLTLAACSLTTPVASSENAANRSVAIAKAMATAGKAAQERLGEQKLIESAKQAAAYDLKDPSSAQFRNVRLVSYSDGRVVCGEINAKNSYGAYVGFSAFMATDTEAVHEHKDSRRSRAFIAQNTGLIFACG